VVAWKPRSANAPAAASSNRSTVEDAAGPVRALVVTLTACRTFATLSKRLVTGW
jgi:hypothetical protein